MTTFKRVSLAGSEELFRPTRPQVVIDTDEVIRGAVDRHEKVKEVVLRTLNFTPEEQPLDKFDALDALRIKVQGETGD
jgi:hypothetical protein